MPHGYLDASKLGPIAFAIVTANRGPGIITPDSEIATTLNKNEGIKAPLIKG